MEPASVNLMAFKSVARYLSPYTLEQLIQTGLTVVENIAEVESDPVYWMKQLSLLEDLDLDYNDIELQGVNWKEVYIRVLNKGTEELLYEKNLKLVKIALDADSYSNDVFDKAIEYGGLETLKLVIDNIDPFQFKEYNKQLLEHVCRYGDYSYFLRFLEFIYSDLQRDTEKYLIDIVNLKIYKNIIKGGSVDILEAFLTILEKRGQLDDGTLRQYFIVPAIEEQNIKIIDYLSKRDYKNEVNIDTDYNIVAFGLANGKYIIIDKYLDKLDRGNLNFVDLLIWASRSRNLRTVNLFLHKEKDEVDKFTPIDIMTVMKFQKSCQSIKILDVLCRLFDIKLENKDIIELRDHYASTITPGRHGPWIQGSKLMEAVMEYRENYRIEQIKNQTQKMIDGQTINNEYEITDDEDERRSIE